MILAMTVVRRLEALLGPTKQAVPEMKAVRDTAVNYEPGLRPPKIRRTCSIFRSCFPAYLP